MVPMLQPSGNSLAREPWMSAFTALSKKEALGKNKVTKVKMVQWKVQFQCSCIFVSGSAMSAALSEHG